MRVSVGVDRDVENWTWRIDRVSDSVSRLGGVWIIHGINRPWPLRPTMSATWPFGQLRATSERITVSARFLEGLVVTRANIVTIRRYDLLPLLGRGLRFEVSDRAVAAVFWTFERRDIIKVLTDLGWTVGGR